MNFAENYERFTAIYGGSGTHPLFLAQAAVIYPHATDEELEALAQQFIPDNFGDIVARAQVETAGGAA